MKEKFTKKVPLFNMETLENMTETQIMRASATGEGPRGKDLYPVPYFVVVNGKSHDFEADQLPRVFFGR